MSYGKSLYSSIPFEIEIDKQCKHLKHNCFKAACTHLWRLESANRILNYNIFRNVLIQIVLYYNLCQYSNFFDYSGFKGLCNYFLTVKY